MVAKRGIETLDPRDLIDRILKETDRVSKLTWDQRRAELPPTMILPPTIPVGQGNISTSVDAIRFAHQLSEIYRQRQRLIFTVSPETFERQTLYAIGDMLMDVQKAELPKDLLPTAFEFFKKHLTDRVSKSTHDLFSIVPCAVFDSDQYAQAFTIGPAHFEPRDTWLARQPARLRTNLIRQVWTQERTLADVEATFKSADTLQKQEIMRATDLIKHIGRQSWIATVEFHGHDPLQAYVKGPLFVELGLDFLSLMLGRDNGRRLLHPGMGRPLSETAVVMDSNGNLGSSWKFNKPGVGGPPGAVQRLFMCNVAFFEAASVILNRYSADSDAGKISRLIERWTNALQWYGDAMRHDLDFKALADYGDALDILSNAGGKFIEMIEYCEVALNVKRDTHITADGRSLNNVVNSVYNLGRSAIRHGNRFGLMNEFCLERSLAHELVSTVLLCVTQPLATIVNENNRMLTLDDGEVRAFVARVQDMHESTGSGSQPPQAPETSV